MGKNLIFALNGERFELEEMDPSMTLLEFLRTKTSYTGAKLVCGEGGCGACVVILSTFNPKNNEVKDFTISSCLTLLCSIHLCSVTTTEGLGNIKKGFHSTHQRLSGFHASQCGYCTPGMCMSLFSAIRNADESKRPEPLDGFSKLTVSEAEKAISGNICRCTGYRPIVDVCKSFAADVDLEDLGLNAFWKKGKADVKKLPFYKRDDICTFPDFLKSEIKYTLNERNEMNEATYLADNKWYTPNSIGALYKKLNSSDFSQSSVKMTVGNTGSGVYKEQDLFEKYIDLRGIPELYMVKLDNNGLDIGAATTISKAIGILKDDNNGLIHPDMKLVLAKTADHMNKIASQFIRNTASLGGNLILAQRKQFPSDIATLLLALDSNVHIQTPTRKVVLTLEEFLKEPPCDENSLIVSITIPFSTSSNNTSYLFETYRAAQRPLGNAIAYLNAAFLAQVSSSNVSGNHRIDNLKLAFGAYGGEHAIRARKVESFLVGKSITESVLLEAAKLVRETISPIDGTTHVEYRESLAVSFLFKFFEPLLTGIGSNNESSNTSNGSCGNTANSELLLSSSQTVGFSSEYSPVGEPIKKVGAELQACGEAVYVDDIPSPANCLHGAFICSTKPLAHIKGIEFKPSLSSQKIIKVISSNDIPEGGTNIGASITFGNERLFAGSTTEYAGQPIGVVIADTQRFANMGAKQVTVNYSTENLEAPILTVEEAVKRSSFFPVPEFLNPKKIGNFSKGIEEADQIITSEVKLGSQYYFYLETQTSLAIPDEDNCITVYSPCQGPQFTQTTIAKCLGIPNHNVRVITRRVGGSFGGKIMRSMPIATACALAAYTLHRPVRMYLDRETDMLMVGGRHPMKINYKVGVKSNGKITALHIDLLINAGISADVSPVMPHNLIGALKKYNWGALSLNIKVCKTNLSSKSAMRAPGEVQGSYIAESIIEEIASTLSLDANFVREINLHTYESLSLFYEGSAGESFEYTLPNIFSKIKSQCYDLHVPTIRVFNKSNQWKKRGISCVPIVYPVMVKPTPGKVSILEDSSIVVEVGGIELGQGLWTKVKQMVAYALGTLWSSTDQKLFEKVRVIQSDTLSLTQGGITGGSSASESSCEAVRLACNVLIERLTPLKDRLEEQMGKVAWSSLIDQAYLESVHLSETTYWVPDNSSSNYLNYGAAVSEVEVDLLTGATTILRTDLIYDCGQSLNPAVDLGQIEGAFVQGIGFFLYEEYLTNSDGMVITKGTWDYKVPTVDTIPKIFNVEILNSGHHEKRVLSSKASGEPPLLLAASVHCAIREAIRSARSDLFSWTGSKESPLRFDLKVPATMPEVKELCGFHNVEKYLEKLISDDQLKSSYQIPAAAPTPAHTEPFTDADITLYCDFLTGETPAFSSRRQTGTSSRRTCAQPFVQTDRFSDAVTRCYSILCAVMDVQRWELIEIFRTDPRLLDVLEVLSDDDLLGYVSYQLNKFRRSR